MSLISSFKGILGETVINVAMWLKLEKDVYHRLNNVTLPLSNGGSTQIDHVIVSVYGIFVIETKNYKGWIFGNEKQRQWTQAFPNGRKYKFQNPLRQNYLHIKTLADLLELDMNYFHSMIAFIGECELKTRDELPEHVLTSGMASYVKKKQDKILTDEEVKAIVEEIESNRFNKSWKTNREHRAYLKDKHANTDKKQTVDSAVMVKPQLKTNLKPELKMPAVIKSREVHQWSGQVKTEQDDLQIAQSTISDTVYITPFDILDSDIKTIETASTESIKIPAAFIQNPTCPKCRSETVKRVAKKRHAPRSYILRL
ncbi:nuclease-related domain-containing protein [uncultured Psychrobacter sp.]|uniref:nuclease-related domain-containing protein n=1 Tax=uncultured Psychrobacter sp. TaxID=259303 RepID=UPI003458CB80